MDEIHLKTLGRERKMKMKNKLALLKQTCGIPACKAAAVDPLIESDHKSNDTLVKKKVEM